MKRLTGLILLMLLLCGCGAEVREPTTIPTETYIAPAEPAGCYQPGSDLETQTEGAVRVYLPDTANHYAIATVGGDVLLFSGGEATTLTRLAGENLYTTATAQLDLMVSPEDPSFRITDNGITYYDGNTAEVVFLGNDLKEVKRVAAPAEMTGSPILSTNRLKLYYCTADAVRVLDLETGLDRLIKEISYPEQRLCGLLMNDTVLYLSVSEGGQADALFLSTETGALVGRTEDTLTLTSHGDYFYATIPEGIMQALVYGQAEGEPQMLTPVDAFASAWYLESANAVVTSSQADGVTEIDYYDLESGLRTSTVTIPGEFSPWCLEAEEESVIILAYDTERGAELILRWNTAQTETGDETVYSGPRYTLDAPDEAGLAECESYAAQLSQQYGVELRICTEASAVEPWDYILTPEYQVPIILRELETLETLLANFPAGFFDTLADGTSAEPVRICLVRALTGNPASGSLDSANGIQFWNEDTAYVAVAAEELLEQTFYHELFHVIETRVFSECIVYYEWNDLNPEGFSYDYDYIANQSRDGSEYLEDDTRAFIDTYSMSFPKEDRARIMEYAATAGNESYFTSDIMQEKLTVLCQGIRTAFGLETYPEAFIWEQYLNKPLAP